MRPNGRIPLTGRLALGLDRLGVSPLCLGQTGDPSVVLAAYDAGINFFFVSVDMHWRNYDATRRGLHELLSRKRARRDDIVVAGAAYVTQPEFCRAPFRELLEELPILERIDVSVAGGAYASEWPLRLPVYEQHRRERFLGVSAIGTSFHDRREALRAYNDRLLDLVFTRYSPYHPRARTDFFPALARERHPRPLLFNFKSAAARPSPTRYEELGLAPDCWRPEPADYYRFALSRPEVDGLLVSLASPSEVEALAAAYAAGPLTEDEEEHLLALAALDLGLASP